MTLLEWWAYEANVLMAGTLATADVVVAVLGIGLAVSGWAYTFPQSLASATCTRVANALGAGQAALAQSYFRTGMMLVLLQQLVLAALIATFSHHIVAFFCSDAAVMHIARGVVPILALNIVFDGVNVVLNGVLRACGRQALGARLQLCSYWLLGVPLAYFLGIKLGLGPKGFVAASGLASLTQALLCSTIFARLDWEAEVQRSKSMLQDMSATMQPVAPALHASPALNVAT
ncbi:hypothetical protein QJQ45_009744 [Haematococcus lacustris]|nr:hypothetical protein QJQ45_009744 [Haematococcus lacustris]